VRAIFSTIITLKKITPLIHFAYTLYKTQHYKWTKLESNRALYSMSPEEDKQWSVISLK